MPLGYRPFWYVYWCSQHWVLKIWMARCHHCPITWFNHDIPEALGTVNRSVQSCMLLKCSISPDNTDGKTFWCEICFLALISQIIPANALRARVKFLLFVWRACHVASQMQCSWFLGLLLQYKLRISVQHSWVSFELVFGITPKFVFLWFGWTTEWILPLIIRYSSSKNQECGFENAMLEFCKRLQAKLFFHF